jgi:hypothetical protein
MLKTKTCESIPSPICHSSRDKRVPLLFACSLSLTPDRVPVQEGSTMDLIQFAPDYPVRRGVYAPARSSQAKWGDWLVRTDLSQPGQPGPRRGRLPAPAERPTTPAVETVVQDSEEPRKSTTRRRNLDPRRTGPYGPLPPAGQACLSRWVNGTLIPATEVIIDYGIFPVMDRTLLKERDEVETLS